MEDDVEDVEEDNEEDDVEDDEEDVEEDDVELDEIKIKGKLYYITMDQDKELYEYLEDGEVGEEPIGTYKRRKLVIF